MTTEQIADIIGIKAKNILWNFDDSREFFVEGEDFFRLNGEELKAAKTELAELIGNIPTGSARLREKLPSSSLRLIEESETNGLKWKEPTIGKRAAPVNETLSELQEKVEQVLKAALEVNIFLAEQRQIEA